MAFINIISENIILSLKDLLTGQSVRKHLAFLMKSQWWDKNRLRQFQEERLRKLITHSLATVPYYKDLFNELGLSADDIKARDDLAKIPVLTKAIIKKEGVERFTSTAIPKNQTIKNSSSGSTGEPLLYYVTKEAYSVKIAANLRGWYWMGYRLGDKFIKLSQNPRKDPIKRLQDKVSRNHYLTTSPLIESNYAYILNEIERYKPKIIRCYPDPLMFLARYKKKHPSFNYRPLAITTTGNTLHPETREEIECAFGFKIFDSYSCEGNSTVFECPTHACYHSSEEYGISEILNENGDNISNGIGTLITTDLWNLAHPFIRYDTQDLVEIDDKPCTCGRNLLKINRILGRDCDVLDVSGGKFIVHNFTSFFSSKNSQLNFSVDQFQVVKHDDFVLFRLVVNQKFNDSVKSYIRSHWEKELQTKVKIEIVDEIPLTASGKRRFIINEQ